MTDSIPSTRAARLVSVSITYSSSQYLHLPCFFFIFFISFCSPLTCCTLFHVSVPLGLLVVYNICMYIICPWSRKRTKKKRRKLSKKTKTKKKDKKITHGHVSQCGFEKKKKSTSMFVYGWILKKEKSKKSKHCMLCSGSWAKGPDENMTWSHEVVINKNVGICTKKQKNMLSWVMIYVVREVR